MTRQDDPIHATIPARNTEDSELLGFAKRAMTAVLSAGVGDVIRQDSERIASSRRMLRDKPEFRREGGLHGHAHPEVCIPLTPGASLDLADARFDFKPPALGVLEPHVIHCEACMPQVHTYQMMWIIFSGSSTLAAISRYRRGYGWDCPGRWILHHAAGRHLAMVLTKHRDPQSISLEPIRADLITLLAELLQRSCQAACTSAGGFLGSTKPRHAPHRDALWRVRAWIDDHLADSLTLSALAAATGLTPNYLNTLFRQWCGEPIRAYIIRRRMEQAMAMCKQGDLLIKQIALRVGYTDALYFSRAFSTYHGITPSQARTAPFLPPHLGDA